MNHLAIVLFGSNLGEREKELDDALQRLSTVIGQADRISSTYETSSWGLEGQPDYLNRVAGFMTKLSAREVLNALLDAEHQAGRIRSARYESRIIDIDLLFYGDAIIREADLTIPHPRMELRRFTLVPLAEIYPDLIHPVYRITIGSLLTQCEDDGIVKKVSAKK
jgi:2-amino-4-hydroxy-6-hydroxymethyldihydropteridine diphosphokinase